jgi:hypothetical protein
MMNRKLVKKSPRSIGLRAVVFAGVWFGTLPQVFAAASAGPCVFNPGNRPWTSGWVSGPSPPRAVRLPQPARSLLSSISA